MTKAYDFEKQSYISVNSNNLPTEPKILNSLDLAHKSVVKVKIHKLAVRRRHISAQIQLPYSSEQIWKVLSDYESFPEYIPILLESKRLEHPTGGIRIEEVRGKQLMGVNLSVRVVFDITEQFPHQIDYQLVEGDMEEFSGYWRLKPLSLSGSETFTDLIFDFLVVPKPILPMLLVDRALSHNISANLFAIYQRIASIFGPK